MTCIHLWAGAYVFPIPFYPLVATIIDVFCLPPLYFCIPAEVRSPVVWWRSFWGFAIIGALCSIFGLFFPLFYAVFRTLPGAEQVPFMLVFVFARVAFEKLGEVLEAKLSPDLIPRFVFFGVYTSELFLCCMMRGMQGIGGLILVLAIDTVENMYYIYCMRNIQNMRIQDADGNWKYDGEQACILSTCLVRELAEILAPIHYTMLMVLLYLTPSGAYSDLTALTPEDFGQTLRLLILDIVVELVVFVGIYVFLVRRGQSPLRFLRGCVCAVGIWSFVADATLTMAFVAAVYHSHLGCDYTFEFKWVVGSAKWLRGLEWEAQ